MINAIIEEIQLQPRGPACIVGDLNGNPSDFKAIQGLLQYSGWTDIGARADIWGKPISEYTCVAPNTTAPTRRDYVFANPDLMPLIADFRVQHQHEFPVHSFLQLTFQVTSESRQSTQAYKPKSFTKYIDDYCREHGPQPGGKEQDIKDFRTSVIGNFQAQVRDELVNHSNVYRNHIQNSDMDSFWIQWNNDIENAFCRSFDDINKDEARHHKGRGKPSIKQVRERPTTRVDNQGELDGELQGDSKRYNNLTKQSNRCAQWLARLKVLKRNRNFDTFESLNRDAYRLIVKDDDSTDPRTQEMIGRLAQHENGHPRHMIDLQRLRDAYRDMAQKITADVKHADKDAKAADYLDHDPYHKKAYRYLSAKAAAPITFLRRMVAGPRNEPAASFATEPKEIDSILTEAWQKIYTGTASTLEHIMENFCTKYHHLLF